MNIVTNRDYLNDFIMKLKAEGETIGFVPTMGGLHQGHLSLVKKAKLENDIAVVSIFVNPTQFNNQEDLVNYPSNLESDIEMLKSLDCDFVFAPEAREMYKPDDEKVHFDFGHLTEGMEGKNRPGHFDGVATIVYKLLKYVPADKAYFGKKDYQQLLIIKSMVEQKNIDIEIVGCEIVREADGLAMSSRNSRLNKEQRVAAPFIRQTMLKMKEIAQNSTIKELKIFVEKSINSNKEMQLEYFELADANSLKIISSLERKETIMGFIVVLLGNVRLIDNIKIF